jgi:hypothetical protein
MSVFSWSTNPNANVTVNGINIAENCPPGNLNDACRSIMAGVAQLRDTIPSTAGFAPLTGAVFNGTQPRYTGSGGYLFNASSADTSGRVHRLPEGSALPSGASNGDLVFFFTP